MNEKSKSFMNRQIESIVQDLQSTFNLPVFADEIAEDEITKLDLDGYNCFVFETGNFSPVNDNITKVSQTINVYYYSENQDNVDEQTLDIITVMSMIKGISFTNSEKQRLQKKETDQFIDRVIITFKRLIPFDRTI